MQNLKHIVIGGGSGFIGGLLKKHLINQGIHVTVLSRTAGKGKMTWTELEKNGLPPCDGVVNLSGENVLNFFKPWLWFFIKQVESSRIDTTKAIATAIRKTDKAQRPKVFVAASGVGFYGPCPPDVKLTENSPPGADYMAGLCEKWESAGNIDDVPETRHVITRLGVVLANRGGAYPQMRFPFLIGMGGVTGTGNQIFPWIHHSDVVGILTKCLTDKNIQGPVNVLSPQAVTNRQFAETVAKTLHRPCLIPFPATTVKTIFGRTRAVMLLEGQNVVPEKILANNYKFQYENLEDAIKEIETKKKPPLKKT